MYPATDSSTTPVYGVRPSKPGLYLGLFHGRDTPNQTMHGWGFDGPAIGPLRYFHTTYACSVHVEFVSPTDEVAAYIALHPMKLGEHALFYTQKNPKRGFTANTLTQYFLHLYRNVGIDGASSHSGRRTFATVLSSKGVGIRVLMRAMGHRNISTTIGYVDASDDMLRKAVDLI